MTKTINLSAVMEVAFTVNARMVSYRDYPPGWKFGSRILKPSVFKDHIFDSMQKRLDYLKSRPDEIDEAFNITDISVMPKDKSKKKPKRRNCDTCKGCHG